MRKIVFIFIFLANAIYGQQTNIDTLKKITVNNNQVFKLKKLIIPTVLIGYGVIGIESDGLKFINSGIKEEVNENIEPIVKSKQKLFGRLYFYTLEPISCK